MDAKNLSSKSDGPTPDIGLTDLVRLARNKSVAGRPALADTVSDLFFGDRGLLSEQARAMMSDILRQLIHDVEMSVRTCFSLVESRLLIPGLRHTSGGIERLVHARAEEAEVEIVNRVPTDLPALSAEGGKIKQILLNLLSNAINFTEPGGRITIEAGAFGGGECVISVSDTGIGMDADVIEIALTPFGQVDSRLARFYEGTGLGLPLCRALTELHGGRLEVTSTKGKG